MKALLTDLQEARGLAGLIAHLGPEEGLGHEARDGGAGEPGTPGGFGGPGGADETARLVSALQGRELTLFGRPLPFCGRREALEAVYNAVRDTVAERRLHIVEVVGAVGLGKTRVLAEALAIIDPEARGIDVLPIAVREGDGPQSLLSRLVRRRFAIEADDSDQRAYDKILEALEPLVDERLLVGHARLIGHLAGLRAMGPGADALPADLEAFRRQAHKALISVFRADLAKHPRILVLQRASRLHETAVEVLSSLVRELKHEPLVLAVLGDDLPPDFLGEADGVTRVRVLAEPLVERELERLITGLFVSPSDPSSAAVIRGLVEAARGNPRLLLESTRLLVQTGRLALDEAGLTPLSPAALRYPLDLEDASRLRVEALNTAERTLLQVAAVIGSAFDQQALLAIATAVAPDLAVALGASEMTSLFGAPEADEEALTALESSLEHLTRAGLIRAVSRGRWCFAHGSDRARLLDEIGEPERVMLHALTAQWLDASRSAEHGVRNQAGDARRIAHHWREAGRPEDTARALLRAAEVARAGLSMGEARALYRQALFALGLTTPTRGLDHAALLGEALLSGGELAHRLGDLQDARRLGAAALEVARALSVPAPLSQAEPIAARAYLLLGKTHRALGAYAAAHGALEIASELFRRHNHAKGSADALVELARLHWVTGGEGGYDRARELLEGALVLRRELGEPRPIAETLGLIANIHLQRGDFVGARQPLEEGLTLSRAAFDMAGQARALMTLGAIAFFQGSREQAIETWKEGLHAAEVAGERELIGAFLDNIGEARLELGDLDHAASALMEAREITRETGDLRTLSDVLKNLALLELRRGDLLRAQLFADEAVALGTAMQAGPTLGPALRARGLVRSERAQRETSAELASKALADLTEAREIFTRLGDKTELERTEAALADHQRRHPPT